MQALLTYQKRNWKYDWKNIYFVFHSFHSSYQSKAKSAKQHVRDNMAARANEIDTENHALGGMKEWTPSAQLDRTASSQLEIKVSCSVSLITKVILKVMFCPSLLETILIEALLYVVAHLLKYIFSKNVKIHVTILFNGLVTSVRNLG